MAANNDFKRRQNVSRQVFIIRPFCDYWLSCGDRLCLWFFVADLNKTLSRINETPVGTITFKYKAAQRRFVDRVLWDRLKRESPVYNGDFIRTADLSEATITFNANSGAVELLENSLIQVYADDAMPRISVTEGGVNVNAEESEIVLYSGGTTVTVGAGAVVSAAATDDGGFNLQVSEGKVILQNAKQTVTAGAGQVFAFLADGSVDPGPQVVMISPRPNAKIVMAASSVDDSQSMPLDFSWDMVNYTGNAASRLEVAIDRNFTQIITTVETFENHAAVFMRPGIYWWRVFSVPDTIPAIKKSAGVKLSIYNAPPLKLISPGELQEFTFRTRKPAIRFQWTEQEEASWYLLEVAKDRALKRPEIILKTHSNSAVTSRLGIGRWYWRVTPFYGPEYESLPSGSGAASSLFDINNNDVLSPPPLIAPVNDSTINFESGFQPVLFSWRKETEAISYTIKISSNNNLSSPVILETTGKNYFSYDPHIAKLSAGQYYWTVFQTDIEGNSSIPSDIRNFTVITEGANLETIVPANEYTARPVPEIRAENDLPAFYVVKYQDTLTKIARQPFVYADATQWPLLYEANRNTFPKPDNPDLIIPGMVLQIPPVRGEIREGKR
ncbi:MAG: LysM peptidoglycan-binding domain-containing protein [Treponema sp.]|nr:LysM peptidoglycan-binding domain-containing protein [Treponema sp.]